MMTIWLDLHGRLNFMSSNVDYHFSANNYVKGAGARLALTGSPHHVGLRSAGFLGLSYVTDGHIDARRQELTWKVRNSRC